MASLETITPVVVQRLYGWGPCEHPATCPFTASQAYVNILLTCGGILSLTMSVLMSVYLGARIYGHETKSITFGLIVCIVINLSNVDWTGSLPACRFVSNYLIGAFFGALARGPNISLLSQIIGPHPKAGYMGILFAVGAVPRVIGPFILVTLLDYPTSVETAHFANVFDGPMPRTWMLYGGQAALFGGIFAVVLLARNSLQPHPALNDQRTPSASAQSLGKLGEPLLDVGEIGTPCSGLPISPMGVRESVAGIAEANVGNT